MKNPMVSRREFLGAVGAATACATASPMTAFAQEDYGGKKIPWGLQLYSVRNECAKDLDGTVTKVAKIGYKGVEFAGYHGRNAKQLRQLLDDVGLKCCGTHIQLDTLQGENLAKTIEFNHTLGNKFLIVASLPAKYRKSRETWQEVADQFTEIAQKVKPHGMKVGYHNHNVEFKPVDGEVPWDTFFNRANKDVVIQFDTGNGVAEGGHPMKFIQKHPGRVASLHVKPYSKKKPNAVIGDKEDELPWKEIFHVCETTGGTEWYIMEYEKDLYPPLVAVEKSLETIRRWGKA
jgi:sugar phosphate isomerase/epimerase